MRIAGRHWAATFSVAVLMHIGLALAVLRHTPDPDVEAGAPAGVRVSFGSITDTPASVATPAADASEAVGALSNEIDPVQLLDVETPSLSEPPSARLIEAVERRAVAANEIALASPTDVQTPSLSEPLRL